ncbi:ribonuclease P protein subunit p20-like [Lytechinus variegatus]|uniref:ribonuclease P protein subunit p20-like n=1 Tax=Lytechinus variegatus TaxID=7654 RepID=UPI001BB23CDF|nr:ribonuclease P protein subunit p20-like [Lytechinus variegatus]
MASGDAQPASPEARPHKSAKPKVNPAAVSIRKRQPRRLPKRKNDIYVTRKSNFASQMEKCEKLFDGGEKEVFIHGLGAAINRALNIALQLETRSLGTLQISISTSTVNLVDDIEPLCDEGDFDTRERSNSAVHIRVFRTESKKLDGPNK